MYLQVVEDKPKNEIIILPNKLNETVLKGIASELDASFITDREKLFAVLSMIGIEDIEQLLKVVSNFFIRKMKGKRIAICDIEKLDLKKLAYEFLLETGITKPVFNSVEEKELVISMFCKLGRLYLHDILFPELIRINPNLAFSTLSLLKRTVGSIAIAEGITKRVAYDHLLLDDIEIPLPKALPQQTAVKTPGKKFQVIKTEYIKLHKVELIDIDKLAQKLHAEYNAIVKKSAFVALVNSNGSDIDVMEVRSDKLKFVVHLLCRMYNPYDKNHKKLIAMSKGKGVWSFLQQNITDETGNTIDRPLRKISSAIMKEPGNEQIIQDVQDVLLPIYNKHNNSKI